MIEAALGDRVVVGLRDGGLTGAQLASRARRGAAWLVEHEIPGVIYVGVNDEGLPVALFAAAVAGVPFNPINYRLSDEQLAELIGRNPGWVVIADPLSQPRVQGTADRVLGLGEWAEITVGDDVEIDPRDDPDEVAVVLFTSGTSSAPKAALLRHRHLTSYVLAATDLASCDEDDAVLVSVPPYHIAGMANLLTNLYSGRRIVYLDAFDAEGWLKTVDQEGITHAMVVPTMLARIVDAVERGAAPPTGLRTLAYGGARMPVIVLERALVLFPEVGFVNAYGLTETSSTIAVLGPDDHRDAVASDDPAVRRRLGSAGRPVPGIEIELRDEFGEIVPEGEPGIIWLRGEQVSGEYATGSVLDDDGWFCTKDRGFIDDEGYLFIEGRADDTIIRGGENIAPAEVEDALLSHPAVDDACVVGIPDDEWGQRIAAVVVLKEGASVSSGELRDHVRTLLRGSKTPDQIEFRDELPTTDTGKLLRRVVLAELTDGEGGN
jgi:acyl-CoA synthetase (AMP-forming)/AMP-acid ligase II